MSIEKLHIYIPDTHVSLPASASVADYRQMITRSEAVAVSLLGMFVVYWFVEDGLNRLPYYDVITQACTLGHLQACTP